MSETSTEEGESRRKNPEELTFLDGDALSRYVTDTGKILPRRRTGLSAKVHRKMVKQVKTSRMMGVIPFTERLSQLGAKRKSR